MSKKLVGGVILLCLTTMALTLSEDGETYTNITQPEILEQLTNLKNYISNPYMIKPVWVQLKNGDEIVVVQGELKVVDTDEFEICVQLNGYKLAISIEFTQATLEDDTLIDDWYIAENDAKYLFTSDAQNVKATIEDADFGNVTLAGDLSVGGDLSITGKINNETNPSVKPIYCHAIYWALSNETYNENLAVSCLIFNNSATPFDVTSFVQWMSDLYAQVGNRITILASGGKTLIVEQTIAPMVRITKINTTQIYFTAKGLQSNPWTNEDAISSTTAFDDGVNKIN